MVIPAIPQKRELFLDPASQITVNKKPAPSNIEPNLAKKVTNMNAADPLVMIRQLQTEVVELRRQQRADRDQFRNALGTKAQAKDFGGGFNGVKRGRVESSASVISISSEESKTQSLESEKSDSDSDMYDA